MVCYLFPYVCEAKVFLQYETHSRLTGSAIGRIINWSDLVKYQRLQDPSGVTRRVSEGEHGPRLGYAGIGYTGIGAVVVEPVRNQIKCKGARAIEGLYGNDMLEGLRGPSMVRRNCATPSSGARSF